MHFRPEFLNRLDDIVFFQPLSITQLSSVVQLQLKSLEERLKEQDITIQLTDKAVQSILNKSYNPSKFHWKTTESFSLSPPISSNSLWSSTIETIS